MSRFNVMPRATDERFWKGATLGMGIVFVLGILTILALL
jgi:hypothetical protein